MTDARCHLAWGPLGGGGPRRRREGGESNVPRGSGSSMGRSTPPDRHAGQMQTRRRARIQLGQRQGEAGPGPRRVSVAPGRAGPGGADPGGGGSRQGTPGRPAANALGCFGYFSPPIFYFARSVC